MYETLSSDYDRFVNWQSRLSLELPFIINKLKESSARHVLDAGYRNRDACHRPGTKVDTRLQGQISARAWWNKPA